MWPLKPQNMKLHLCWERHRASSNGRSNGRSEIFCEGGKAGWALPQGNGAKGSVVVSHARDSKPERMTWETILCHAFWELLFLPENLLFEVLLSQPTNAFSFSFYPLILVHVITKFLRKKKNSSLDIPRSWLFLPNKGQIQTRIYYSQVPVHSLSPWGKV